MSQELRHFIGGKKVSGKSAPFASKGEVEAAIADGVRFYTRTQTVTSRWPAGIRKGAQFTMPTHG